MSLCVLCQENPSRKHGKECRKCYKRLWDRDKRKKREKTTLISLEDNMFLVDRKSFVEWDERQ